MPTTGPEIRAKPSPVAPWTNAATSTVTPITTYMLMSITTCRDQGSCGKLRTLVAGRSDESAGSPGPDSPVATALPVVGDGWAGLHLRRDGRGHRRVPPPLGEDRVGAERGPARHHRLRHALRVPLRGGDRRHPRRPDRAPQRHALRADLLLRLHARRRGSAELPG